MDRDEAAPQDAEHGDEEPSATWQNLHEQGLVHQPYRAGAGREIAEYLSKQEPIAPDITTEDILLALGRELDPYGVEPGGRAAAEPAIWDDDGELDSQEQKAVLPPRVTINGTTAEILRALGMPDEVDTVELSGAAPPETVGWGGAEPDPVWLDLYEQGLVRPPYHGVNSDEIADILAEREPIRFKGTTEDVLRALGRL